MRTIRLTKPYDHRPSGTILEVPNNAAHDLIERGIAELHNEKKPSEARTKPDRDKQLRPGRKGGKISTK